MSDTKHEVQHFYQHQLRHLNAYTEATLVLIQWTTLL